MKALDVFASPEAAEVSAKAATGLLPVLSGLPVPVRLSALFSTFLGVCKAAELDPFHEFETLLAHLEGRRQATHRGGTA